MTTNPPPAPAGGGRGVRGPRPLLTGPPLDVPADVLVCHRAVRLEPEFAVTLGQDDTLQPTVYLQSALKINGLPNRAAREAFLAVQQAAVDQGYRAEWDEEDLRLEAYVAGKPFADLVDTFWVSRVLLSPSAAGPMRRPDAWKVLQQVRANAARLAERVGLVHVMTACATSEELRDPGWRALGIEGLPAWDGHAFEGLPAWDGHGTEGLPAWDGHGVGGLPAWDGHAEPYGRPGYGGRTPVAWGGAFHWSPAPEPRRNPVVCVMDTGIGEHEWFAEGVEELTEYAGIAVGVPQNPGQDPELYGVRSDLSGLLDRDAGHGTFIAGIIRQQCPSARILAVPVMVSDGSADDMIFQRTLVLVLLRHLDALASGDQDGVIDVLSLSLGYYHETPEDLAADAAVQGLLHAFGMNGVAVVCAAGNDGTTVPMFPAAFAPRDDGELVRDVVPLTAVGAYNPDGSTIAMYSNAGPWVRAHRRGTSVVSTIPTTFNASIQSGLRVETKFGTRATVDPDNFASGFAVWSGTSFAAPVLAGEIAQHLASDRTLGTISREAAVSRAWAAVTRHVGWERP